MTDFEDALRGRLAHNEQLAEEQQRAEREMDRAARERQEEQRRRRARRLEQQRARHTELTDHVQEVMAELEETAAEQVVVRAGWTESGEEFVAKLQTVGMDPRRSLLLELDRDDDEVLVRWRSEVGDSLERYRLTRVTTDMLDELVLSLVDQSLWQLRTGPPSFPEPAD